MKKILFSVFIGLVVGFVVGWICKPCHGDTVYIPADTVFTEIETEVPTVTTYYIHDTVVTTLPEYIHDTIIQFDTIKIVEAYLGRVFYSDTITNDDFEAVIKDTISQNRIISRQFYHKNLRECTYQPKLIIGAECKIGGKYGMFITGGYDTPNWIVNAGYDPFNRSVKLGAFYKF